MKLEKNPSKSKQTLLNISCGIVVFAVNIFTSFFLSPYIVQTLGVEAKGFVTLATNFVSYATLVIVALNSLSNRFITIKIHQGNYEGANRYYSSVFAGNIITLAVLFLPAIFCIVYIDRIVNVPPGLVTDVKILFALVFSSFFISTGTPKWQVATFATNKLHLKYIRDMESNLIKLVMTVGMFSLFNPHIYYVGAATCVTSIFVEVYSCYYKRKLLPQIKIKRRYVDFGAMKELIGSGIWMTVANTGATLLTSLDLVITNLFIGDYEMGIVSVAKTIPAYITELSVILQNMFMPELTIHYAKEDKDGLLDSLKKGISIMGVILTLPIAVSTVFGKEFYSLWQPTLDAELLYILSILSSINLYFTCGIMCAFNVFTVTNKLKPYALMQFVTGAANTVIVLLLLKFTDLGIYAVAGASSVCLLIGNLVSALPLAAKYIGMGKGYFFPQMLKSLLGVVLVCLTGFAVRAVVYPDTWLKLVLTVGITCVFGFLISFMAVVRKKDRQAFWGTIKAKIRK